MEKLEVLRSIEQKIERIYVELVKLEIGGVPFETESYQSLFHDLCNITNEEKRLLQELSWQESVQMRKLVMENVYPERHLYILGTKKEAVDARILNRLDMIIGDDLFDYAAVLRYDMNQILFSLLDFFISNEYYSEIRESLIYYRFNLLFLNGLSESDLLNNHNLSTISLQAKKYRTDGMPSTIFVDETILVLEGREYLETLATVEEGFQENDNRYALVVISLMELLARLILCEQKLLPSLNRAFVSVLEGDDVPIELKKLMQDMYAILEQLQSNIKWAK